MMPSVTISRSADPGDDWRDFAIAHGTFYHRPEWTECLRDMYRFRLEYFSARAGSELRGILALAEVPALLGPRRLVSLPFSYAAGPLAGDDATVFALAEAARERARQLRISRVEIKSRGEHQVAPGYHRTGHYSTYEVPTEGGEAALWGRLHPSSTQRSIRKGQKSGLVVRQAESREDWRIMAELEERTAHGHGLPAPPRRFFTEGCRSLQGQGLAALYLAVTSGGAPAASITLWKGPRSWIYAFGASDPSSLEQRPNHVLIWTAMADAAAAGCRFDLGRAAPEQEGLVEFKRRWGGQALRLAYDYWPEPGGLNLARRDRGSLAAMATVWSRLPASVARLGSGLYRYLG
jgi:GNAT acetyltransferase-like protein